MTLLMEHCVRGVGLPPIWWGHQAQGAEEYPGLDGPRWFQAAPKPTTGAWFGLDLYYVHLDDYQTRQGVLRQLAMWTGDDGSADAYWLKAVGFRGWKLMRSDDPPDEEMPPVAMFAMNGWNDERDKTDYRLPLDPANTADQALADIVEWIGRGARP